jgi:hypothetical protein
VRFEDIRTIPRWAAAAALVLAFFIVVLGVERAISVSSSSPPPPHGAHALPSASLYSEFAAITEHPHAENDFSPVEVEAIAYGVLPGVTTTLAALGLVATMAMVATVWRHSAIAVIRGPPRAVANVMVGQVLLTHFCIARR